MRKIIIAASSLAFILAGCSQNELLDGSQNPNNAIGFGVYTPQSRGAVLDNGTIEVTDTGFGILASYTEERDFGTADKMNFMYNEHATYSMNGYWGYTPLKYWPNTSGEKISFFAYAPYESTPTTGLGTGTGIVLSAETVAGYPTVTYSVKGNPMTMGDFVYAHVPNMQRPATLSKNDVKFTFSHGLTRVNMKAIVDNTINTADNAQNGGEGGYDGKTAVCITNVDILGTEEYTAPSLHESEDVDANPASQFYESATFDYNLTGAAGKVFWETPVQRKAFYPLGDAADDTKSILNLQAASFVSGYTKKGVNIAQSKTDGNATDLFKSGQYLFLIPVGTSADASDTGITAVNAATAVKVAITYDIVTIDSKLELGYSITTTTKVVPLTTGTLLMGKAYNYTFNIGIAGITVESKEVNGWGAETSNTIN